jgi:hypothetical protein
MVHDTLHVSVRGYVETSDISNSTKIVGWAFHEKRGTCPVRLVYGEQILNAERVIRNDIVAYYGRLDVQNAGWIFHNHNNFDKDVLTVVQMLVDEVWVKLFTLRVPATVSTASTASTTSTASTATTPSIATVDSSSSKSETPVPTSVSLSDSLVPCDSTVRSSIPSFVVADNFYENPDSVRNFALSLDFKAHEQYHKGKRTDVCYRFPGLKERFEQLIGAKIKGWDNYGTNACFQYCVAGEQIVYHHDSQEYAGVLFLTPDAPPQTGTTFYRSKHTKSMKVPGKDHAIVFQNGFLDPTAFDVVDVVGNVYNRIVLFDAMFIHAASCYFGTELKNGRLFQLFFFDIEK